MQLQYTTNFSNAKTQNRTKSPCFFPLKGLKTPTKAPISDALPLPNAHKCVPKNQHLFVSWRAFWCKTACLDAENGVYRPFLSNLGKPFSRQSERKAVSLRATCRFTCSNMPFRLQQHAVLGVRSSFRQLCIY